MCIQHGLQSGGQTFIPIYLITYWTYLAICLQWSGCSFVWKNTTFLFFFSIFCFSLFLSLFFIFHVVLLWSFPSLSCVHCYFWETSPPIFSLPCLPIVTTPSLSPRSKDLGLFLILLWEAYRHIWVHKHYWLTWFNPSLDTIPSSHVVFAVLFSSLFLSFVWSVFLDFRLGRGLLTNI